MSRRITHWLEQRMALELTAGFKGVPDFNLTPGQYAELCVEQGSAEVSELTTCKGVHKVTRINCHVKATGDNVILCPREDLFQEVDRGTGIELVSLENDVTSIPDNIGCVEVISVGELVRHVKPGDVAFIDFYDVKQGYVIANETLFLCGGEAFKAFYDVEKQRIVPGDNYVVTRAAKGRFAVALTGTDRLQVIDSTVTDGIVSGRSSKGTPAAHTLYQEVVSVGSLTTAPRPGVMTTAERRLLDLLAGNPSALYHGDDEAGAALDAVVLEREDGRAPDFAPGELVAFALESATKIRVRGEYQYLMKYDRVLAVIDDAAILDDAIARGTAGMLVRGGGFIL